MEEDSDDSDSEDDDFYDENINFSDNDRDFPPCAHERHISINAEYPTNKALIAIDNLPPMQLNGSVGSILLVADNGHPIETMLDFSKEGEVGLQRHSNYASEFMDQTLPFTVIGAQSTSSFAFETTILDSSEGEPELLNTFTNPNPKQYLLPLTADVEKTLHKTSEERRARHPNLIEQRQEHSLPLAIADSQAISSFRSTVGPFSHKSSKERRTSI